MGERVAFPTPLAGRYPVGFPGRIPASVALSGPRPEPSEPRFWGLGFTRRNCRPERLVEAVLGDLLPHWGYENDSLVVAEVITTSGSCARVCPCRRCLGRPSGRSPPARHEHLRGVSTPTEESTLGGTTHWHWQCEAAPEPRGLVLAAGPFTLKNRRRRPGRRVPGRPNQL